MTEVEFENTAKEIVKAPDDKEHAGTCDQQPLEPLQNTLCNIHLQLEAGKAANPSFNNNCCLWQLHLKYIPMQT